MKSQTSTEYLIILAVVIIIALIVVGVLGGIPGIGGESDESVARAALAAAPIGITNYVINGAKGSFEFVNNLPTRVRLENATVDGTVCWFIGTNADPVLTPSLNPGEKVWISCGSATATIGELYEYDVDITYTDLKSNAVLQINNLKMVGRGGNFWCPDGYVAVPGGFVLADGSTVDDFCVMKYEAKEDSSGACADGDSANCPVSVAAGTPWVDINQTDAILECQSLGSGYDLISDQQWMVLAENILNTPINDLDNNTAGPQLGNGNSNGASAYAAGSHPVVTGCDLQKSLADSANAFTSTCQLRGTDGTTSDFGYTSDGSSNFGIAYNVGADSRAKLRTHVLSNGEVIWDIAGNVYQFTSTLLATTPNGPGYYDSALDFTDVEWMEPSQARGITFGFGSYWMNGNSDRVAVRGGYWSFGEDASVFYVDDGSGPSDSGTTFGFRCVYSPN